VKESVRGQGKEGLILFACYLVALSWVELIALIVVMTAGFITHSQALTTPFIVFLVALIFTVAIYVGVALSIRCSSCGRRMLIETLGAKHPKAKKVLGLDHWASNVVNVIRVGRFNCMYCGVEHIVRRPDSSQGR
jgi:predicted DNA repair protein MutK